MRNAAKFIYILVAVATLSNCRGDEQGTQEQIWHGPCMHPGNEVQLCGTADPNIGDPSVCSCNHICALTCGPDWICTPGCERSADCSPGYRCDIDLGVCVTSGITDENEGTCDRPGSRYVPFQPGQDVSGGGDDTTGPEEVDADNDGYTVAEGDCDDTDASVHPGAEEVCDGKDNDCDGDVDEGDVCLVDADQDGSFEDEDCNDFNDTVYPGHPEVCGDGLDNDCNGIVDDEEVCKIDNDGDGYSPDEGDCNDNDFNINPGALELCEPDESEVDNDCDGYTDEGCPDDDPEPWPPCGNGVCDPLDYIYCPQECDVTQVDLDNDGYTVEEGDCDDSNFYAHPGMPEVCGNGVDDDCNSATSDVCPQPCGNGVCEAGEFETCPQDCPMCGNGICEPGEFCIPDCGPVCGDNICSPGESTTCPQDCLVDMDDDGYPPPEDCNDFDFTVHPGAAEVCDGKDNDCNPLTPDCSTSAYCPNGICEEGEDLFCPQDCGNHCPNGICEAGEQCTCIADCGSCTVDMDGDGYSPPADCNDFDFFVHPGAPEVCDGKDNDCNPQTIDCPGGTPYCPNGVCEGEEYLYCPQDCGDHCPNGICEAGEQGICEQDCPTIDIDLDKDGYSVAEGDCNDANWYVNPGVAEKCVNYVDDDCDGLTDEGCVYCGNGVCDHNESYSTCALDCDPICGNGVREDGEQCDGNDFNGLSCQNYNKPFGDLQCSANCMIDSTGCYGPICGNSECEQGETPESCQHDCGSCGDTIIGQDEECDDGNFGGKSCQWYGFQNGLLACSDECEVITTGCFNDPEPCGNGVLDDGEPCDGNLFGGLTCQSYGFEEGSLICLPNCTISTDNCYNVGPVCGNGVKEAGEACDPPQFDGLTCEDYDFDFGSLMCVDNCTSISTVNCFNYEPCGNGILDAGEPCDGNLFGGLTCQDYSFEAGSLMCVECAYISTDNCYNVGPVCGNGVREAGEACDPPQFGGATCQSEGFDAGSLTCTNNCQTISTVNCYDIGPECGNGVKESGEECDGNQFGMLDCSDFGFDHGELLCLSNCTISTAACYDDPPLDTTNWVAKPCEGESHCIELNSQYLDWSMEVYVVGDCPSLDMYNYDGVWSENGRIRVYDTDNDGYFELHLDPNASYYDCEISFLRPDPNPDNEWSWAQYEGYCLASSDPESNCGPYLNCGYNQNSEYVCNVHFLTPSGDASGAIEYSSQYPSTW